MFLLTIIIAFATGSVLSPDRLPHQSSDTNTPTLTCDRSDRQSPCSCRMIITNIKVHVKNKPVIIQFPEYVCNQQASQQKIDGFKCTQITSSTDICNDVDGNPINVSIAYKSGCELRCTDEQCPSRKNKEILDLASTVRQKMCRMLEKFGISDQSMCQNENIVASL